jgi:hypothetical protein
MLCTTEVCIMVNTKVVCQIVELAREPKPVKSRVEEYLHPVKDGEITEQIRGLSLAPTYSFEQLREMKRRRIKKKLDSQRDSRRVMSAY